MTGTPKWYDGMTWVGGQRQPPNSATFAWADGSAVGILPVKNKILVGLY